MMRVPAEWAALRAEKGKELCVLRRAEEPTALCARKGAAQSSAMFRCSSAPCARFAVC